MIKIKAIILYGRNVETLKHEVLFWGKNFNAYAVKMWKHFNNGDFQTTHYNFVTRVLIQKIHKVDEKLQFSSHLVGSNATLDAWDMVQNDIVWC